MGERLPSRWVWLEAFVTLLLADEGDDRVDVVITKAFDRWHRTEIPMVGCRPDQHRDLKGAVPMVTWLIEDRKVRRASVGPSEVGSVTFGAGRRIQHGASRDQFRILLGNLGVRPVATRHAHKYGKCCQTCRTDSADAQC